MTELSATFAAPIHYFNRAILHFAGSIRYILHFYPIKKGMHCDCAFLNELEK